MLLFAQQNFAATLFMEEFHPELNCVIYTTSLTGINLNPRWQKALKAFKKISENLTI